MYDFFTHKVEQSRAEQVKTKRPAGFVSIIPYNFLLHVYNSIQFFTVFGTPYMQQISLLTLQACCRSSMLLMEWHVNHLSDDAWWSANVLCGVCLFFNLHFLFRINDKDSLFLNSLFTASQTACGWTEMDRYRYFIFNQKSMVILGLLQIACATVCLISGVIDGAHRRESVLGRSRTPIWAGVVSI